MLRPRRVPTQPTSRPEDVATVLLGSPPELEAVLQAPQTHEGVVSQRLWLTHTDQSPLPLAPVFTRQKRRGRPMLLALSVVVLASLLLGAGTLVAQQHIATGHTRHQAGATTGPAGVGGGTRAYTLPRIPTPTSVPAAPTATPLPPLPDFAVIPPFCNVDLLGNPLGAGTPAPAGCVICPYVYDKTQYTIAQVQQVLQQAAALYQLPPLLVEAISLRESGWVNTGLITCEYDSGLFGLKQGYWQYFDELSLASCGLSYNTYDPTTLAGNADMGAKLIKFLYCYYGWAGDSGGTQTNPGANTNDWYYQRAGLSWPDLSLSNGQPNPNSLCAAPRRDSTSHTGYYVTGTYTWQQVYAILPTNEPWSCPFSAAAGDHTLYELAVAAYQAGTGAVDSQSACTGGTPTPTAPGATPVAAPLCNQWYVQDVSTYLVDLSEGVTPT